MNLNQEPNKKKIYYLEGLRGLAALNVFIVHLNPLLNFNKPIIDTSNPSLFTSIREIFISPLFNGDYAVFLFWAVSAFVLTFPYFSIETSNEKSIFIKRSVIKRYFRLGIPVFIVSAISFLLIKTALFFNHYNFSDLSHENLLFVNKWFNFDPSPIHLFKTSLIDVYANSNCNYNPVLWTIQIELLGSFLCFALLSIFGDSTYRFKIIIGIFLFLIIAGLMNKINYFYSTFLFGLILSETLSNSQLKTKFFLKYLGLFLLFLSVIIQLLFNYFAIQFNENLNYLFQIPIFVAGVLLLILHSKFFQKLLSIPILVWFGKLSFSFYLIHFLVLMSLGAYLKILFSNVSGISILIAVLTFTLSLIISFFLEKWVDQPAKKIAAKFSAFILND
jgi:peptidoglycan/LPS O-acetylase OafA/YrhL